ncbi:MAG TPA: dTDP-4-dehydrorhamnose 3,5-epimerase [Acidimicrobiales bacterium]|jgi:dTDP-4-dehydrorhamnose 3,5-epimerase
MQFTETPLAGVFVVEIEPLEDERGLFARSYCADEFVEHGLDPTVVQCNISFNRRAGTLRGMHHQAPPVTETKLVRCTRGALHDVVVDLRPDSPSFREHVSAVLSADNRVALYIPKGLLAHGFQTLEDDSEVFYQMGERYVPGAERGVRYDDPALGLEWPLPVSSIAKKDTEWPLLDR